ncbi:hypothetical protein JCM8202_002559 [Rhodotorula sphaerocarpa]
MHASTVLVWLAPSLALARIHLDVHAAAARQLHFDTPDQHRMPVATQPRTALALGRGAARPAAAAAAANPSVVVHVVDPASPSTSFVTAPHVQASQAAARDPASQPPSAEFDDEDEEEEAGSDSPNFGRACDYSNGGAFQSCGDYFDEAAGLDHGLFCSPANICAGKNAVCGASEACNQGLICDLEVHRCVEPTAKLLGIETARRASRRESAAARCPLGAEACPTGRGGFECVHVETDDQECGACRSLGGRDCSRIEHALATSCRRGGCVVHACLEGYVPSEDASECI